MILAPIVLFTYCRPHHTQKTIEALLANKEAADSDLIIYSDGAKDENAIDGVEQTRKYIHSVKGFKSIEIIERSSNMGLANSIIDGVTSVVNQYGRVIVVEDDLVTSPYFLQYLNNALALYESNNNVISIHGYMYPVKEKVPETFFIKTADCWGWATWKRGWDLFVPDSKALLGYIEKHQLCECFDFEKSYPYTQMLKDQIQGLVDSWAIRWYASAFINNKLTLYPGRSLVFQNGMDGNGGTHCGFDTRFAVELADSPIKLEKIDVLESETGRKAMTNYFLSLQPRRKSKFKRFIKKIFH